MNRIARKVTKRIATQWVKGEGLDKTIEDYNKTLKCLFMDGISSISKTELRKEFQDNEDLYFTYLKRCIAKLNPSALENLSLQNEKQQPVSADKPRQEFCVAALMKSLKKTSYDDIDELVKIFDNYLGLLSREKHGPCWLSLVDRLVLVSNGPEIKKVLTVYLSKLAPEVDKCLSDQNIKRAQTLQASLRKCFTVLVTRHFQNLHGKKTGRAAMKDLIASLMSLYLDLTSLLSGDEPDRELVGFVSYVLRRHGASSLDVLLQQTADSSSPVIVQFARYCLKDAPVLEEDCAKYLCYMLCISKFRKHLPMIFERARNIRAPLNFLDWLEHRNSKLTAQMPDDRKFRGRQITNFLLNETNEELNSQLLDVLTVDIYGVSESTQNDEEGKSLQTTSLSYVDTEPAVEESLENDLVDTPFYVDRKGEKTSIEITEREKNEEEKREELNDDHHNSDDVEVYEVDLTSLLPTAKQVEASTTKQSQNRTGRRKKSTKKQRGHIEKQEVVDVTTDESDIEMTEKTATMSLQSKQTEMSSDENDDVMEVDLTSESDHDVPSSKQTSSKKKVPGRSSVAEDGTEVVAVSSTDDDDDEVLFQRPPFRKKPLNKKMTVDVTANKTPKTTVFHDDTVPDDVEILKLHPATQSQSSVDQAVTTTVDTNFTSQSKTTPKIQHNLSPVTKRSDSLSLHFTTDEEEEPKFSNLISTITDDIVSPVRSPPASLSKRTHSSKKTLCEEDLEVVDIKSDSDVDNSIVRSSSHSPRKRKQNKNLSESGISVLNMNWQVNDVSDENITEDIDRYPEDSCDLKLDEPTVTSSESKNMSATKSGKLLNIADGSGSKLNSFRTRAVVHGDQKSCVLSVVDSDPEKMSKLSPKCDSKTHVAMKSPKTSRYSPGNAAEMKSPVRDSLSCTVVSSTVSIETESPRTRLRSHSGSVSDEVSTSPRGKSPRSPSKHQDIIKSDVSLTHESEMKSSPFKSPQSTNTVKGLRIRSPSHAHDVVKRQIGRTSADEGTPKIKSSPSKRHQLTKINSPSPIKGSPDKNIHSDSRSSSKKKKLEFDSEELSEENVFKEDESQKVEEKVELPFARKRMSLDSKIKRYSFRSRVPDSPTPQSVKDSRNTSNTPTKKAREYDCKDDTPLQQVKKKPSTLRRKSCVAVEVQPRRYSLRTRKKADS